MTVLDAKTFGTLIRQARKRGKMTQKEVAAAAGIGERFVRELEQGKGSSQLEKSLLVARMVGIKVEMNLPVQNV
jgi:HTH-type transcriptional regulator/antitoxin HipB